MAAPDLIGGLVAVEKRDLAVHQNCVVPLGRGRDDGVGTGASGEQDAGVGVADDDVHHLLVGDDERGSAHDEASPKALIRERNVSRGSGRSMRISERE